MRRRLTPLLLYALCSPLHPPCTSIPPLVGCVRLLTTFVQGCRRQRGCAEAELVPREDGASRPRPWPSCTPKKKKTSAVRNGEVESNLRIFFNFVGTFIHSKNWQWNIFKVLTARYLCHSPIL